MYACMYVLLGSLLLRTRDRLSHLLYHHPPNLPNHPTADPNRHRSNSQTPARRRHQRPREHVPQERIEDEIHRHRGDTLHQLFREGEVIRHSIYA